MKKRIHQILVAIGALTLLIFGTSCYGLPPLPPLPPPPAAVIHGGHHSIHHGGPSYHHQRGRASHRGVHGGYGYGYGYGGYGHGACDSGYYGW